MSKKPALHPEYHIARALQHVALDILEDARTALNHRSKSDASVIHDYRKAQKRWRALLRLLGPFLGERGRQLRTEARDLARELGVWFTQHAQSMDAALALHLRGVGYDAATGQVLRPEALPQQAISGCGGSCSS